MASITTSDKIQLILNLFKGREDVFAVRWEKEGKSGYQPACFFDPHRLRTFKMGGGLFKDFNEKTYLKLTEDQIQKHLDGHQQIGIYPLLGNDTSWFLVADFDKTNWQNQALIFQRACQERDIPCYLERSRSGNGGHGWIFFDEPYPAVRSRKIFISILEDSGAFSKFDKNSSFDRLFPSQDFLSGKGFGNLIALPFFKPTFEKGNSCFINPETLEPFENQWELLRNIRKVSRADLDNLLKQLTETKHHPKNELPSNGKLKITLDNKLILSRIGLTSSLINYLKEELNFANSEFFVKKQTGLSTYNTNRFFKLLEESETEVVIPRGFTGKLLRFCRESKIEYEFEDKRKLHGLIPFSFNAILRSHQQIALESISKKDFGVIVAPPGSGKTVVGLKIIAEKKQPSLIVVHRKQLLNQWIERIEVFLGIPQKDIGIIGQGKAKLGKQITVATFQSLPKQTETIRNYFGTVIIDECHHVPAESFRNTIEQLSTYYLYGLTATPFRKYNDGKLIFTQLGDQIVTIQPSEIENFKQAKIIIRTTELDVPFNSKIDSFENLSKILINDTSRNKLIVEDVKSEVNKGKKVVIITERKDHISTLNLFIRQFFETITLSGEDSDSSKKAKWKQLNQGDFEVLITTGQYFGEGADLRSINSVFLVYPFSFEGKLIQYMGRVQRSEINPTIYDYRDIKIDYLNKLFLKRNSYYRKIERQATLFEEPKEVEEETSKSIVKIDKIVKVPIQDLEFHYGSVVFYYFVDELDTKVEIYIYNIEIRPEFEVLKPYFVKNLASKNISASLNLEFDAGKLISQLALSSDIDRINKELIEGVKFQFFQKELINKNKFVGKNIFTSDELQNNEKIYSNAEELLSTILANKHYLHSQHIQYLAERHVNTVMKIRFVLHPFAFIFLLSNENKYFLVLETLDTEEATYVWGIFKSKEMLIEEMVRIEAQLSLIREKGRQIFLESSPDNFSRVLHDYSNDKKGFILWKSCLEEFI